MHVEVKYPIGSDVLVRLRIKGVGITPTGMEYVCVDPEQKYFNSITVPEALVVSAATLPEAESNGA